MKNDASAGAPRHFVFSALASLAASLGYLYLSWQLPMYRMDFKRIEVPLDELKDQRDANFWSEVGY